mgnify:CR=1 FL=1
MRHSRRQALVNEGRMQPPVKRQLLLRTTVIRVPTQAVCSSVYVPSQARTSLYVAPSTVWDSRRLHREREVCWAVAADEPIHLARRVPPPSA